MIEGDELELFAGSVRRAAAEHSGAALDAALDALGWDDAFSVDPRAAVSVLFEAQGRANTTSSALDRAVAATLGVETSGAGVVLPPLGGGTGIGEVDGDRLTISGVGTAALARGDAAAVVAGPDGSALAVVPTAALDLRPVVGIDPALGLVEVGATIDLAGATTASTDRWTDGLRIARVALGHELVGASRTMVELARAHALERVQFGRPIAMFQAVRHRLAEALVAVETAEAILEAAWLDGDPTTAAMAKAVAGRSARTAARHCQQVLAGIGFTTEHDLHRYLRRVLVLDELVGSSRALTRGLGEELVATRRLPPLLPL